MLTVGFITLFIWVALYSYSQSKLRSIPSKFSSHDKAQKIQDIRSYQKHLLFFKFTKFMFEKMPYIAIAVITIIAVGPFGVLVVLAVLWFKKSLFTTNYRGYKSQKKAQQRHMRQLDEWVVIANQTILQAHTS